MLVPGQLLLILALQRKGIYNEDRNTIYTFKSPSLTQIIQRANYKSVNLYCEALLKAIGKTNNGDGSLEAGTSTLLDYWATRGVNIKGVYLDDGSGLSARNAVTTRFMAQVLRKKSLDKDFEAFYQSIPLAGKTGSMRNTLKGTLAEGRLSAKSGTIKRVRSLQWLCKNSIREIEEFFYNRQ